MKKDGSCRHDPSERFNRMQRQMREEFSAQQALQRLAEDMERVRREFAETQDEDLLEACTFELKALEARCRCLLRGMREETQDVCAESVQPQTVPAEMQTEKNDGSKTSAGKKRGRLIRICGTDR